MTACNEVMYESVVKSARNKHKQNKNKNKHSTGDPVSPFSTSSEYPFNCAKSER